MCEVPNATGLSGCIRAGMHKEWGSAPRSRCPPLPACPPPFPDPEGWGGCGVWEASWCGVVWGWGGQNPCLWGWGGLKKLCLWDEWGLRGAKSPPWGCSGFGGQNPIHGDVWGLGEQNPPHGDAQDVGGQNPLHGDVWGWRRKISRSMRMHKTGGDTKSPSIGVHRAGEGLRNPHLWGCTGDWGVKTLVQSETWDPEKPCPWG